MKKKKSYVKYGCLWLLVLSFFVISCDTGFDSMNVNEREMTSIDPVFQLNEAILESRLQTNYVRCESSIVKQQIRVFTGQGCGNFNVITSESDVVWNNGFQTRLNNLISADRNTDSNTNLNNMIRIWKAYTFMMITDSYGDVPYREAGLGFLEGITFPNYDTQESIYTSSDGILQELANATAALDPNQFSDSRIVLYNGNIEQWKRLGNSLLLRGAMRLSKVAPELAEQYVNTAVTGGLFQSNDDNALIAHNSDFTNIVGSALNGGQAHFQYLVEDFIDFLRDNDDPRLASIAVRYPTATGPTDQNEANADRNPANQIGIPMGFDNTTIAPVAAAAGLPSFMAYSQVDRTRMMDPQAPSFLATYSLQQFYLAEAAHRNWISGDPAEYFEQAIEAHMHQISNGYQNTEIAQSDIDAYIQANPLETGREFEQINTQFWVASYLIPTESWANFRRSGYPDLVPNPIQTDLGPDEGFMRRFVYPDNERTVNPNVSGGVNPDRLDTRVWWDVKL